MPDQSITVVFVYNARSGIANKVMDGLHKMVSPTTYNCELCQLSHGNFGMKPEFKKWIDQQKAKGVAFKFQYKNEVEQDFPVPFVEIRQGSNFSAVLSWKVISNCKTSRELMQRIEKAFTEHGLV